MSDYPKCGAMYVDVNGDDRLCCLATVHQGPHTDTAGSPERRSWLRRLLYRWAVAR